MSQEGIREREVKWETTCVSLKKVAEDFYCEERLALRGEGGKSTH